MPISPRVYLLDIQRACQLLIQFTVGKDLQEYEADVMLRSAVERQLMIVGEAVTQLLKVEPLLAGSITRARGIVAFRNVLVHRYATVSNATVWGIVQSSVPTLLSEVEGLLKAISGPP